MRAVLSDLTQRAAAAFGAAPALMVIGGGSWSFAEIDDEVARFAGLLAHLGIGRGDRVVLHLPNGREWIVAYHAIARLGAVVAPANILLSPQEVAFMVADAQAKLLIVPADRQAAIEAALEVRPEQMLAIDPADEPAWQSLLDHAPCDPVHVDSDELFTLCYTSGTTGRPKGAMLSHGNVHASMALTATVHVRSRGERVLTALPFPHVYGNIVMNAAFLVGMELLLLPRFEAGDALHAIARHRPTLFEGVPTMFYQMLAHPEAASTDFTSLSRCTVGGQTMPLAKIDEVVDRFGCPLCELWGMTEVAGPATSHSPYWPPRHGTIGLPFPGVEFEVRALGDRKTCVADGGEGELWVRGPMVTRGYWRNPEATAEAIDGAGWLATGDIGVRDADGYLRIVDRAKDLIISGGYNIYPAELEQALAAHPAVAMVAVAGIADPEKGEIAKAFVVLRPGISCERAELEAHCRERLARYKVPREFAFVDELPRTSTGKIMRRALRETAPAS